MQYYAGLYMRVSKEDQIKENSESIENQKKILTQYCRERHIRIAGEYIDEGFSGTNFNRPSFQRLISDAEEGRVNMVIVKDASRLGRNSGEVDYYTNVVFSKLKLRYIALSDGIDKDYKDADTDIKASFVNLMNEWYAGDISRKIRAALLVKMQNGEYIGSFAPFGYQKETHNKNRLCVDTVAAEVVKSIFEMAAEGLAAQEIANQLNKMNIKTPSVYRASNAAKEYQFKTNVRWSKSGVIKILNNEVYRGHTLQGKTMKVSYKSDYIYLRPKNEQIFIADTHTPIICDALWEKAHHTLAKHHIQKNHRFVNIFSGIAYCADCKSSMSSAIRKSGTGLICGSYKSKGKNACTNHYTPYDLLCETIKKVLSTEALTKEELSKHIKRITVHQNMPEQRIDIYMKEICHEKEVLFKKGNKMYIYKIISG